VREITRGEGVAVVYDGVGKDTFAGSLDSLRTCGMMVSFGNASGPVPPFDPLLLSQKGSLFLTRPTLMHYTRSAPTCRAGRRSVRRGRLGQGEDRGQPDLPAGRRRPRASRPRSAQAYRVDHPAALMERLRARLIALRYMLATAWPIVLITAIGLVVAYQFVAPEPPQRITISTGSETGAYHAYAQRYAAVLAGKGITLDVRNSAGSHENLERLEKGRSRCRFRAGRGGCQRHPGKDDDEPGPLRSLGSVAYEPVWVFYRGQQRRQTSCISSTAGALPSVRRAAASAAWRCNCSPPTTSSRQPQPAAAGRPDVQPKPCSGGDRCRFHRRRTGGAGRAGHAALAGSAGGQLQPGRRLPALFPVPVEDRPAARRRRSGARPAAARHGAAGDHGQRHRPRRSASGAGQPAAAGDDRGQRQGRLFPACRRVPGLQGPELPLSSDAERYYKSGRRFCSATCLSGWRCSSSACS
jgi:hypothetical protein